MCLFWQILWLAASECFADTGIQHSLTCTRACLLLHTTMTSNPWRPRPIWRCRLAALLQSSGGATRLEFHDVPSGDDKPCGLERWQACSVAVVLLTFSSCNPCSRFSFTLLFFSCETSLCSVSGFQFAQQEVGTERSQGNNLKQLVPWPHWNVRWKKVKHLNRRIIVFRCSLQRLKKAQLSLVPERSSSRTCLKGFSQSGEVFSKTHVWMKSWLYWSVKMTSSWSQSDSFHDIIPLFLNRHGLMATGQEISTYIIPQLQGWCGWRCVSC